MNEYAGYMRYGSAVCDLNKSYRIPGVIADFENYSVKTSSFAYYLTKYIKKYIIRKVLIVIFWDVYCLLWKILYFIYQKNINIYQSKSLMFSVRERAFDSIPSIVIGFLKQYKVWFVVK